MADDEVEPAAAAAASASPSEAAPSAAPPAAAAASPSEAAPARSSNAAGKQLVITCPICYDDVPTAASVALCGQAHRFCVECGWGAVRVAVSDGLVPACPFDKEHKCGAIAKAAADAALTRWLGSGEGGPPRARRELSAWAVRGRASAHTSGKIDEVYRSAELARQGLRRARPGKGSKPCKEFVVPAVAHASFPQRCARARRATALFCASCRQPYHYRTGCAEALRVNARWVKWLQIGARRLPRRGGEARPRPLLVGAQGALQGSRRSTRRRARRFRDSTSFGRWSSGRRSTVSIARTASASCTR